MRTRIKFCGLVEPDDVDVAIALGVDAIGLVFFERSPRFVSIEQARVLRARMPSFVTVVGLFVDAGPEVIARTASEVGLDVIQFHGDETPSECMERAPARGAWWRAVRMRSPGDLLESATRFRGADAFLLDAYSDGYGGSGKSFDWSWIRPAELPVDTRLILAGGLSADTVGAAIDTVAPFAVDVSSGIQVEGHPRRKDRTRMERFVAEVAAADARTIKRMSAQS